MKNNKFPGGVELQLLTKQKATYARLFKHGNLTRVNGLLQIIKSMN